jgi:hypothetical protein
MTPFKVQGEGRGFEIYQANKMNKTTVDSIQSIIIIIMGIIAVIFHKRLGFDTAKFWNLLYAKYVVKGNQLGFLLMGLSFIIIGLLTLFHIINFK